MARETSDDDPADDAVARFASTPPFAGLPARYPEFLESVSEKVRTGRTRIAAAVNRELVATYWAIGRDIRDRQTEQGWGTKVIDRLSSDLRDRFPEAKGFSPRNLKYMRHLPRSGMLSQLCKHRLHNCPGTARSPSWRSSTDRRSVFGTRLVPQRKAGLGASSSTRSRRICANAPVRRPRISRRPSAVVLETRPGGP